MSRKGDTYSTVNQHRGKRGGASTKHHSFELGDKSHFLAVLTNIQNAGLGTFEAINVNQRYSLQFVILLFALDFCQLVAFPISYAKSSWGIMFLADAFSPSPIVNAYHNDGSFLPFVIATLVLTTYMVLVVYGMSLLWARKPSVTSTIAANHWVFKVLSPFASLLMTVGYIPLLACLFGFAWSLFDGSISNSGGGAVGGVIVMVVTIVFMAYIFTLTATVFQRDPFSTLALARPHARVDVAHFLFRTVLVVAHVAFGGDHNISAMTAISLIGSLSLAYSYTVYLPYYDFSLSRARASIMWVVVVFNVAVIIKEVETLEQWGSILFLYAFIPLAVVASSLVVSHQYQDILSSPIGKLSTPYLVELKCRMFMACDSHHDLEASVQHDGIIQHPNAVIKEGSTAAQNQKINDTNAEIEIKPSSRHSDDDVVGDDEYDRLHGIDDDGASWKPVVSFQNEGESLHDAKLRVVRRWYTQATHKFPQSSTLFLFFAQHLFDTEKDNVAALPHVRTALTLSPLWDQAHLLNTILKENEALLHTQSAQFLRYISYRDHMADAVFYDALATKARIRFLTHVAKVDNTDTDLIFHLGSELEKAIRLAKTHYDAAFAINRTTCPDLRAFGRFLTKIYQFPEMGQAAFKSADRIDAIRAKAKKSKKKDSSSTHMSIFDSDNGVVCTDETGVVVTINDAACRMLGYQVSDMVARPWASMAPRPFSAVGDDFLFFHTPNSTNNIQESPRRPMFLNHKAGHCVPVIMDTRRVTVYDKDVVFVSVIHAVKDDDAYVIVDAKGSVASWSHSALTIFPSIAAEIHMDRCIPDYQAQLSAFETEQGGVVEILESDDDDETSDDDGQDRVAAAEPLQVRVWATHDEIVTDRGERTGFTILRVHAGMDAVATMSANLLDFDKVISSTRKTEGKSHQRGHSTRNTIQKLNAMDEEDTASETSMGKKSMGFSAHGSQMSGSQMSGSQMGGGGSRYGRSSRRGRSEFGRSRFSGTQKVDVGWLRVMYNSFPQSSLRFLTFITAMTCLVVAVASIASYLTMQSFTDQYASNMDVLYQAQLLRSDLAIASSAVTMAFHSSLGVSKAPATDLAEARRVMDERAKLMHQRFTYLIPSITQDPDQWQMAFNATLPAVEIQETHTYTTHTVTANLHELVFRVTDNLKLLAQEQQSVIGSLVSPRVYYFLNNDEVLNTALNVSAETIADHQISKMDEIATLEIGFASATLIVVFLAIILAWRPAVNRANAERQELLAMIYEVPRHVIKRLLKQTQVEEEDENSEDDMDLQQDIDNSDDDLDGTNQDFSLAAKKRGSSNLVNQVRIFSLLVLCLIYFLSMMVWSIDTMKAEKARAHRTIWAGSRLMGMHRMELYSRMMTSIIRNPLNPLVDTSALKEDIMKGQSRIINETRAQHSALLYGNDGWPELGRDDSQKALYFGSNCVNDVVSGFVSAPDCQTWYNGINTYGLDAALERYTEFAIVCGTQDRNPTYNTTVRSQLFNRPDFQFIVDAEKIHLRTGLEYSLYRYNADSVLGLKNLLTVRVWVMVGFLGAILAIFMYVHVPLIGSLNSSATTTELILLNIPLEIIRSVPQLNLHLERSIQKFNNAQ